MLPHLKSKFISSSDMESRYQLCWDVKTKLFELPQNIILGSRISWMPTGTEQKPDFMLNVQTVTCIDKKVYSSLHSILILMSWL